MPPWYVEKNIGIQKFKNDPSLSDEEIAKIAKWADSGAPRGNPADMPPPTCTRTTDAVGDRHAGSRSSRPRSHRQGQRARLVGRDSERADRPHRRSLRRGARDQGSQRRRRASGSGRADGRRPLRVPPHDLEHARARTDDRSTPDPLDASTTTTRRLAGARSGPQRRLLRPEVGAAAEGRLEHRLRLGPPPLERPRHQGAPRDRLQVHAEGLQADLQARRRSRLGNGVDIDIKRDGSRTSSCTPTRCCSEHTKIIVVRAAPARARACGCASRRSGATTSRR